MDFSGMFDDPFLSDYKLHLRTPEQQELACLNIHGVVLAGQSPYFKSLLANWMGANEGAISLTITEDELAPMLQLLQCAYRGRVVGEVNAHKLVATILLADRYQLRNCEAICRDALLALDSKAIDWDTVLAILHMPPGLRETDTFKRLLTRAQEVVGETFLLLEAAWQDAGQRARFMQLPREAVAQLLDAPGLQVASENTVFIAVATWLSHQLKHAKTPAAQAEAEACVGALLPAIRYPFTTHNFLSMVASWPLLAAQPAWQGWVMEAYQYNQAGEGQREALMAAAAAPGAWNHTRFLPRPIKEPFLSAFTSYIAYDDLQQAFTKYRASGCTEAYYLLTAAHYFNGFLWRLKLTVKPPDDDSKNDVNVHVGLCWSVEVDDVPVPLSDAAMLCVDFDIATWDFIMDEEDPTSSEGMVVIKANTCWGWDDFFGPEVYSDSAHWRKFMNDKDQLLLTCHLFAAA